MLFLLQIAFGLAFLGYLILAIFDAIRGCYLILTGLCLVIWGQTLIIIGTILQKMHPPVAPAPREVTWKVVP